MLRHKKQTYFPLFYDWEHITKNLVSAKKAMTSKLIIINKNILHHLV